MAETPDAPQQATYPMSATFGAVPTGASASRRAAPPSDYWNVHGMHMRIPPLFDQLHLLKEEAPPGGFTSYTQWARVQRQGAAGLPVDEVDGAAPEPAGAAAGFEAAGEQQQPKKRGRPPKTGAGSSGGDGRGKASKDKDSSTFNESAGGADFGGPGDEKAEWKRQWSVVVRRDILRQQRAIVGGQKDVLTQLKRTGIACQKEIRKKALRGQRLASNPQIQV